MIAHEENAGKQPWIKIGTHILSPEQVISTYQKMGAKYQVLP